MNKFAITNLDDDFPLFFLDDEFIDDVFQDFNQ